MFNLASDLKPQRFESLQFQVRFPHSFSTDSEAILVADSQISFEPGFGAYQSLAQKIKVAFSRIVSFFLQFWGFEDDFKTRAKPRYAPNSGWKFKRFPNFAGALRFHQRTAKGASEKGPRQTTSKSSKSVKNFRHFSTVFRAGQKASKSVKIFFDFFWQFSRGTGFPAPFGGPAHQTIQKTAPIPKTPPGDQRPLKPKPPQNPRILPPQNYPKFLHHKGFCTTFGAKRGAKSGAICTGICTTWCKNMVQKLRFLHQVGAKQWCKNKGFCTT